MRFLLAATCIFSVLPVPTAAQQRVTRVPTVVGLTEEQAREVLLKAGLTVGTVGRYATQDRARVGRIAAQNPVANDSVSPLTPVDIMVLAFQADKANAVVPDLVGQHVRAAPGILNPRDLTLGRVQRKDNFNTPDGIVLQQKPAANERVNSGVAIDVIVASNRTEVPHVAGLSAEAAAAMIAKFQLRPGKPRTVLSDAPEGTVVRQQPVAGEYAQKGWIVSVEIAGPQRTQQVMAQVIVPDLKGRSLPAAKQVLERAGLIMGRSTSKDAFEVPKEQVLEQSVQPQSRVARGTTVDVTVASEWTEVPAVTGMPERDAVSALRARQLAVANRGTIEQANANPGSVVKVEPGTSARVQKGFTVGIQTAVAARPVVAAPPPAAGLPPVAAVIMPSVVGADSARAHQLVSSAELRPIFQVRDQPTVTMNAVLDQEPQAGSRVSRGAAVTITLSSRWTLVPSLSGSTVTDARRWLEQADLVLNEARTAAGEVATERIAAQNPQPGTRVLRRSAVEVTRTAAPQVAVPPVVVPPLANLSGESARSVLASRGLRLGSIRTETARGTANRVIAQTPLPMTRVVPGSAVDLVLSVAPEERATATPPRADPPIEAAPVQPQARPDPTPAKPMRSAPAVSFESSDSVIIPNLIGLARGKAAGQLKPLGLRLRVVSRLRAADRNPGTVLSQGPAWNQRAPRGSVVEVAVASGISAETLAFVGGGAAMLALFGIFATIHHLRGKRNGKRVNRKPIYTSDPIPGVTFYPGGARADRRPVTARDVSDPDTLEMVAEPIVESSNGNVTYRAVLVEDAED